MTNTINDDNAAATITTTTIGGDTTAGSRERTGAATAAAPPTHDWRAAGAAWGHEAADWSCLFEHYAVDTLAALFERTGVGVGTRLLDIACGSGLAARMANARGAEVAGIDAARRLVEIARRRTPDADVRVGSMFDLPWADASFDVALSINGIWGGCQAALDEAHRVLRPDGVIGLSYWGTGEPLDLRPVFYAIARHLDRAHVDGMLSVNEIGRPGVAAEMLEASGFEVADCGARVSSLEWPDADIAWRAIRSIGPIAPAIAGADEAAVRADVLAAIEHCRDDRGVYRFRNLQHFIIGTKPA